MTLTDVYRMIDQLTPQQQQQVRAYIEQQQVTLRQEIDAIIQNAPSPKLQSGTMDADRLQQAVEGMWAGLNADEIGAILQAMNEEFIEPDQMLDE